jgi:hypothetical protein
LEFRQSQSSWAFPTIWLTPDALDLDTSPSVAQGLSADLGRQFRSYQALLSAIFLADSVELHEGEYWIVFRGLGRTRFAASRTALLFRDPACAEALHKLYTYVYDGFSADKLEIAQQFLSLTAKDLSTLCDSAVEIRDATEKTYNQVLVGKVEDYFDARHKVQERIKTAIAETSEGMIDLTREVSADLYKIAGILAGAVVATLLKPELGALAFLAASVVVFIYLALVIFFHLDTMEETYKLRMRQHSEYIHSFIDVLRTQEIDSALGDEQLGEAERAFTRRLTHARIVYSVFLTLAAICALVAYYPAVQDLFQLVHIIPPTPTPTP